LWYQLGGEEVAMRHVWFRLLLISFVVVPLIVWVAAPADAAPAGLLDPAWGAGGMLVAHLYSLQHFCQVGEFGSVPCGPMESVSSLDAHGGRVYMASPFLGGGRPLSAGGGGGLHIVGCA
jgi:hypothetical protein